MELQNNNIISEFPNFEGIISSCKEMQSIFEIVKKVSKTDTTILVLGESGTGKELIAKALHNLSKRQGRLVPVNCAAIPEEILESELFGHEKGAFTGAINKKQGRFELADNGTIFLDEIGEMSTKLQAKLLRVLQDGKIDPVGSTKSIDVNVRVVAATNKDLKELVNQGRFREDLYYRLQVVPIELPALRLRQNDISLLANYFISHFAEKFKKDVKINDNTLQVLSSYNWPGNVRELENLSERLVVLSDSNEICLSDLPSYISNCQNDNTLQSDYILSEIPESGIDFNGYISKIEDKLIESALRRTNGNKKAAAELLKLNRTTLVEKIKKKNLTGLQSKIEVEQDSIASIRPNFNDNFGTNLDNNSVGFSRSFQNL